MRDRECKKVLLNHYILPGVQYEDEVSELLYSIKDFAESETGKDIKLALRFPEERDTAMNDFIGQFEEGQKSNEKLLA